MRTEPGKTVISPDEYLAFERAAKPDALKHEYLDGVLHPMIGASKAHNLIIGNLYGLVRDATRASHWQVHFCDVKVRIPVVNAFYYPDLVVAPVTDDTDEYVLHEPVLVAEVLSPHTEATERSRRLVHYRTLPSMRTILLIAQADRHVDVIMRGRGRWTETVVRRSGRIEVAPLGLSFDLADLYNGL